MEEIVTFVTEDHCFPPSGYHDALPCFFALHILELPDVMHFEVSPALTAEFTEVCGHPLKAGHLGVGHVR